MSHPQPHIRCAGRRKNARGRAQTEHALHRVRQVGVPLRTVERRNQATKFGRIESWLDFYSKPLRQHDAKPPALPHARSSRRAPVHRIILNDLDRNNLLLGYRPRDALPPRIQREHVQSTCRTKLFTPQSTLLELQNQTLCLCPAQPALRCNYSACVHPSTSAQQKTHGKNVVARTRTIHQTARMPLTGSTLPCMLHSGAPTLRA